jgi:small ubiquitin-related modifier
MGTDREFTMREDTRMEKLFAAFAERTGVKGWKLVFDGARVLPDETPRDLEMEDGDIVDAILEQAGD